MAAANGFVSREQQHIKDFMDAYEALKQDKAIYDEMGGGGWADLVAYFGSEPGLEFSLAQFALIFNTITDLETWFDGESPAGFARLQNLYRVMSLF